MSSIALFFFPLAMAIAASSVVVHQLGTTGTATLDDLAGLVGRIEPT